MVNLIELFGFIIELASVIIFFIVVFYVYQLKFQTKGFQEIWSTIALGFALIIASKTLSFIAPFFPDTNLKIVITSIIIPFLLLTISILFVMGFYKLNALLTEASKRPIKIINLKKK